jgi:hypothetical protein
MNNRTQYIDSTLAAALKLMDKFLAQTAAYSSLHSSTLSTLTTLQNQHSQALAAVEVQRSHGSYSNMTALQLQSLPLDAHPESGYTSSLPKRNALIEKFPDLPGRLIIKLDLKMAESLQDVRKELEEMASIVKVLAAIRRDALSKASTAMKEFQDGQMGTLSKTSRSQVMASFEEASVLKGHLPLLVEVAGWIDGLVSGYEMEVGLLDTLLRQVNLSVKEGVSNLDTILRRWGEQSLVDLRWEQEVSERVKLFRTMSEA